MIPLLRRVVCYQKFVRWGMMGLFAVFLPLGCARPTASALNQVCFQQRCFTVEVVQKQEELYRGLQFRRTLAPDAGMLFVFAKSSPYAFWMKNTLIPLDMIWMDYAHHIVYIAHDVPPCKADPCPTYTPSAAALYVLEINAGYAAGLGIKVGDTAEFRLNNF